MVDGVLNVVLTMESAVEGCGFRLGSNFFRVRSSSGGVQERTVRPAGVDWSLISSLSSSSRSPSDLGILKTILTN